VQFSGKEYASNRGGLRYKPILCTFFDQLSVQDGGGGGGPTWMRHRVGAHVVEGDRQGWGRPPF
jgi:hypothetical protein